MERASASAQSNGDGQFRDGLGERRLVRDASGAIRELLCIRAELADVPSFEFALRERVGRLSAFRHPYFAPIRTVERLAESAYPLGIVSERFNGIRLPLLYARLKSRALRLDIDAVVFLLRQLLPALVKFHDIHRDVSHGAIAPDRILFTANGRLMVTEYALGAALEQLRFTRPRYWRDLRAAIPHDGMVRFDQRTDVAQIGALALSLILGRSLRDDEYPDRVGDAVAAAWAAVPAGGLEPVPPPLRDWLVRALQIDVRRPLTTSAEAAEAFERAVASTDYPGEAASIDAFLAAYRAGEPVGSASGGFGDPAAPSLVPAPLTAAAPVAVQGLSTPPDAFTDVTAPGEVPPPFVSPAPIAAPSVTANPNANASANANVGASTIVPPLPMAPPNMAVSAESAEFLDAFMSEAELEARLPPGKSEKSNRGRRGKGKRGQPSAPVSSSPSSRTVPAPPVPPALPSSPPPTSVAPAAAQAAPAASSPEAPAAPAPSTSPAALSAPEATGARTGVIRPAIANRPSSPADAVVPPPAASLPPLVPSPPGIAWPPPADYRTGAPAPSPRPSAPAPTRASEFVVVPAHADFDADAALPPTEPLGDVASQAPPRVAPNQPGLQALPREWQVIVLIIAFVCAAAALVIGQRFLTPVAPMATGTLVVTTNPRGVTASIDGQPIGTTPLSVTVPAGEHELVLQAYGDPRRVTLNMAPGGSIEQYFELPVPPEQAAPQTGWLTLRTPIEVEVLEGGRVIGSSAGGRLSLPTGVHTLLVRNDALGFSATRLVNISAGKSTTLTVDAPKGTIVVHAVPYADVWLDGRKVGQTPIENLPVTIGTHDLVLRHPDLGDHRQTLSVTLTTVSRVSVDLRKP